ncbi:MAG: hypothetical protein ACI959_000104 [Limisphaerales bacterium]|jgi:hypothetical protein
MNKITYILFLCFASLTLFPSCDFLFGSRDDSVVNEIFEEGSIDPELFGEDVGYVPIQPFWGGFDNPIDVFVGYDEMVYVIDDNGLNVLDQAGTLHRTIPVQGAVAVAQDRRLHTYVAGRVDFDVDGDGTFENLAAVYRYSGTSIASDPILLDTIIHPFGDVSRNITAFRGEDDEAVVFTGLTTLADNSLYVSRKGPRNNQASIARPDNTVLFYNPYGDNIGYSNQLSPIGNNLRSTWDISGISGFAAPPQTLSGLSTSRDFIATLQGPGADYKVLWLNRVDDPLAGIYYQENAELILQDPTKADRFLYEPNRFISPEDVFIAPDGTGYIFVVDSGTDSLYQFTQKGYEGVNPPANSAISQQIIASFGGEGSGPFQFRDPSGVAYFRRTVYVADKGNGRISRFKLSTDLE